MHAPRIVPASTRNMIVTFMNTALASVFLIAFLPAVAEEVMGLDPYVVYVAHDEVYARCGPSDDYYRTDPLRHGQELEVYVETEDGWLGIRPPDNSFCWIPASAVELGDNNDTGKVIEDRSVSWIGTHLGRARQYRWQVQLAAGEPVTIIGRSERDGPDGPQLWYRIVPPSGEFRWVHRDQTVNSTEALVASVRRQQVIQPKSVAVQPTNSTAPRSPASSQSLSSRRSERDPGIKPIAANDIPSFRQAPEPTLANRPTAESSSMAALPSEEVIGSGLNDDWDSNAQRDSSSPSSPSIAQAPPALPTASTTDQSTTRSSDTSASLATASFLGQPRLVEIGAGLDASAPAANEPAGDGNWVSGAARSNAIAQVSGIRPLPAQTLAPNFRTNRVRQVSPARLAEIENEVRGASVEKLQIVLSHLMANEALSGEVTPVISAAIRLGRTTNDEVTAGRARLIAERAEQYQRVAERREDSGSIDGSQSLVIPASRSVASMTPDLLSQELSSALEHSPESLTVAQSPANLKPLSLDRDTAPQVKGEAQTPAFTESGFLVQVYSVRPNSPPFALTDHAGNTIAYVTPAPGINLRNHLNSRINVMGNRGFLQGLNTPHILVTKAIRSHE